MNQFGSQSFNWNVLSKTAPLSSNVREHLKNVYGCLSLAALASTAAVVHHLRYHWIGRGSMWMPSVALIGIIFWIQMDSNKTNYGKRIGLLCAFGYLQGMVIAPLIELTLEIDASILTTAFVAALSVFVCFSASALLAKRRSYLYIGGFLSSCVTFMALLSLMNIFWRSTVIFDIRLYGGLAMFCLYILYDTQMIVEKASLGDYDIVGHAINLYIDLVAVFIRILIILLKNRDKKEKKSKSSRR
eukprot:234827_1